jgi:hypothetical protein
LITHQFKRLTLISASLLSITACGVPTMIENTVTLDNGDKITVEIQESDPSKNRPNPIAHMLLLKSTSHITSRKSAFIAAAEVKSGCNVLDDTFTFIGGTASVAAVELDC